MSQEQDKALNDFRDAFKNMNDYELEVLHVAIVHEQIERRKAKDGEIEELQKTIKRSEGRAIW